MKKPVLLKAGLSAEALADLRRREREVLDRLMEKVNRREITVREARELFQKEMEE